MADHTIGFPQVSCDARDCIHESECVLLSANRLEGEYFPRLRMAHSEPTHTDPSCHGDLEIMCCQYKKKEKPHANQTG